MIAATARGLGCPKIAMGLSGPSYPYPLRMLNGLGDEVTPESIAATSSATANRNSALTSYANQVMSVVRASFPGATLEVQTMSPTEYNTEPVIMGMVVTIGSYQGPITVADMQSISAADWGRELVFNANQANTIVASTNEPTPVPIPRLPIITPVPTPVQPPTQLQIYQPRAVTDVNLATGQPAGVTPTTGPTTIVRSTVPTPVVALQTTGVQSQYAPVSTQPIDGGYASAGADGQVASSPMSEFLQGTWIDGIPNWLLLAGVVGAFALFRKRTF